MLSTWLLYGVLALAGLLATALALLVLLDPLVARWRTGGIPLAPATAHPDRAEDRGLEAAGVLARSAVDNLATARSLLARRTSDLAWLLTTTGWALLLGGIVGVWMLVSGTGIVASLTAAAVTAGAFALFFAVAGLLVMILHLPGVTDATHSVARALDGWEELARAHAVLVREGVEVPDLPAFRHPLQGRTRLLALLPRPLYSAYRFLGVGRVLAEWQRLAGQLAEAAEQAGDRRTRRAA